MQEKHFQRWNLYVIWTYLGSSRLFCSSWNKKTGLDLKYTLKGVQLWQDVSLQLRCQCRTAWLMAEWRTSALHAAGLIFLLLSIVLISYQLYKCKGSSNNVTQACPLQKLEVPVGRCCICVALNWDVSEAARCYFCVWSPVSAQGTMAGGFGVKPGFCNTADLPAGVTGLTLVSILQ